MCQPSLVLMPLNTEAPSGLIVIFQAVANCKLIITTDTVTTREYFGNQRGVLCENDLGDWEKQVRYEDLNMFGVTQLPWNIMSVNYIKFVIIIVNANCCAF